MFAVYHGPQGLQAIASRVHHLACTLQVVSCSVATALSLASFSMPLPYGSTRQDWQRRERNPLKNAPHTAESLISDDWDEPYTRETATYPLPWVRERKFCPAVGRVDNVYGDRNLVCACPSLESYLDD